MNRNFTFYLLLLFMSMANIFTFFGCKKNPKASNETLSYPPFTIQKRTITDRQWKPNEGTVSKHRQTKYKVLYKNEDISFPDALDANTGVSGIWKTFYLPDAPTPTLIIASKNVYLVNEKDQAVNLTPIANNYSNYASVQWLDAENGQPGPKTEILLGEDTSKCILQGGQYLLLNETSVLRLEDLNVFHYTQNSDYTLGYDTYQVLGFSPDKREIVFMGSKSHETHRSEFIQGLVVYNFENNQAYAIPIDKTETRLHKPYDAGHKWLYTHYEWHQNEDGKYLIAKKTLSTLPFWTGHFSKSLSYVLSPVSQEMHDIFLSFTKELFQLSDDDIKIDQYAGTKKYRITSQGFVLAITYQEDFKSVSFSTSFMNNGSEEEALALIRQVGEAFNEKLNAGKYQDLFTDYSLPDAKGE